MIRGKLWGEARANTRTALRFVAETVGVIMGAPSTARSDLDERRVGV